MNAIWRIVVAAVLLVLSLSVPPAVAGYPQPYEHPELFRQANMVMLKFQESLAAERWDEALSFCSGRVCKGAAKWATRKEFFVNTMPLDKVSGSYRFAFCGEQHGGDLHIYKLFINLTPPRQQPVVQWHWNMFTTNNTWAIDWEPSVIDLDALIEKKNEENREHQKRVDVALRDLGPKLRAIKTHLTAVSDRFVIGSPMLFQVELLNFGKSQLHFTAAGVAYHPLRVFNENRQPIPFVEALAQIMMREGTLPPGSSEILAEKVDITKDYSFAKPGTYFVQFDGAAIEVGERIPRTDTRFGRDSEFISTPTRFPSNVIKIEVVSEEKQ